MQPNVGTATGRLIEPAPVAARWPADIKAVVRNNLNRSAPGNGLGRGGCRSPEIPGFSSKSLFFVHNFYAGRA